MYVFGMQLVANYFPTARRDRLTDFITTIVSTAKYLDSSCVDSFIATLEVCAILCDQLQDLWAGSDVSTTT